MALRAQDAPGRRELQPGDLVDVYLRMSRDPGHDELGVQRQRRECEELCQRRGWRIATVHVDDDRSAYSGKPRPGYNDALERLALGTVRGIVAWHPDRLHRSPKELEAFIDLVEETGAAVVTARAGEYDLSTPAGRMQARIFGAIARHESEHKSERILTKMKQLREDGRFTGGGKRPYGYEARAAGSQQQELRPAEAEIVRELKDRALAGESLLSLVRDLNAHGVPSATGEQWTLPSMSRLLKSARIAGLREYLGREVPAPWPAIITVREHHDLRMLLEKHARSGERSQRSYLLTGGIVKCGACGADMIGRPLGSQHRPNYACVTGKGDGKRRARPGCNKVFANAAAVDELVRIGIMAVVDGEAFTERLDRIARQGTDDGALQAIARQEERVREIEDQYADGELTRQEYQRLRVRAQAKLEELRGSYQPNTRLSALEPYRDRSLADAWENMSLGQKRAIIEALGLTVHIAPAGNRRGPRFDTGRVTLRWTI